MCSVVRALNSLNLCVRGAYVDSVQLADGRKISQPGAVAICFNVPDGWKEAAGLGEIKALF